MIADSYRHVVGLGCLVLAAVTLIAAGAWVTYRMVLLAVAEWRRRHRAPHPLARPGRCPPTRDRSTGGDRDRPSGCSRSNAPELSPCSSTHLTTWTSATSPTGRRGRTRGAWRRAVEDESYRVVVIGDFAAHNLLDERRRAVFMDGDQAIGNVSTWDDLVAHRQAFDPPDPKAPTRASATSSAARSAHDRRSERKGDAAEREVAAIISELTGWPARRMLGAGRSLIEWMEAHW